MIKFEVSKVYAARSIGDYDCIFKYVILKRTKKTVTIKNIHGEEHRRTIEADNLNGVEFETIYPEGKYSFAPRLKATNEFKDGKIISEKPRQQVDISKIKVPSDDLPEIDGVHFEIFNPFGI